MKPSDYWNESFLSGFLNFIFEALFPMHTQPSIVFSFFDKLVTLWVMSFLSLAVFQWYYHILLAHLNQFMADKSSSIFFICCLMETASYIPTNQHHHVFPLYPCATFIPSNDMTNSWSFWFSFSNLSKVYFTIPGGTIHG